MADGECDIFAEQSLLKMLSKKNMSHRVSEHPMPCSKPDRRCRVQDRGLDIRNNKVIKLGEMEHPIGS